MRDPRWCPACRTLAAEGLRCEHCGSWYGDHYTPDPLRYELIVLGSDFYRAAAEIEAQAAKLDLQGVTRRQLAEALRKHAEVEMDAFITELASRATDERYGGDPHGFFQQLNAIRIRDEADAADRAALAEVAA